MASDAVQSALLSKLEASLTSHSADDIHSIFSDHLRPFSELAATAAAAAKPKKSSKSAGGGGGQQQQQQGSIRSLAKQYLSFFNRSLSLLPKLLSAPRTDQSCLFETYGLCLDCLGALSSQLACKPYSVHVQRSRYVHCFESCGLYADAASEGFRLMESLRGIDFGGGGGGRARGKFSRYRSDQTSSNGKGEQTVRVERMKLRKVMLEQRSWRFFLIVPIDVEM